MRLSLVIAVLCAICCTQAERPRRLPASVFGRPVGGFLNNPFRKHLEKPLDSSKIITGTVTQKVDNFDSNNKETWQQHYQYNPTFYNGSGLIFLLVGGESKISMRWISDETYTYLTWAKKYGAAAFQAEHRFYGASHPKPDMSTESYQYFTVNQALADLRVFVLDMNKKYFANVTKPRWAVFGGSYPGSLSAWFREANPDLTIGAISSSCAVNTLTDYWGYIDNMGYTYSTVSADCANNIKTAFIEINKKIYTKAGRAELVKKLNLCPAFVEPVQPVDIQFFLQSVIGIFMTINQYTGDNRDLPHKEGLGVPRACAIMNDAKEPDLIKRVNNVQNFYNGFYYDLNTYCNPNNYTDYMVYMADTSYDPPDFDRASARGWTWQTCTQLGYFQTTDGGYSMFGSAVPMDFFVNQCMQLFGDKYDADFTKAGAAQLRMEHGGGYNYKGTKVVFPNGSFDPWKGLGYMRNQTGDVHSILIDGTAHCADMYPANATTDKPSLIMARKFEAEQLDMYIRESLKNSAATSSFASLLAFVAISLIAYI